MSSAAILLSGQGTVQTAVEATKLGALDFLEKHSEEEIAEIMKRRGW